jgi:glycosyltransferase involved in cell wall biosynthesis
MFQNTRATRFGKVSVAGCTANERGTNYPLRYGKKFVIQTPHTELQMMQETGQETAGRAGRSARRCLRILQISPTYYPAVRYGGPIRSVHALSRALAGRGNEVHVFTSSMDGSGDLALPQGPSVILDGVHVHYFQVPMLRRLCWCPTLATALKGAARDFDVMHLHSVFQWPIYAAARVAASAGLPYLLAPRGMLGEAVIRGKSRFVKSAWIRLIEQRTLSEAAGLHVTTDLEAREIRALDLRLPEIFCVPNSVSWPTTHTPLDDGPLSAIAKPYVLFLSRIDWKKGLDRLIEAWRWVPELTLVIAGNDEEGYWKRLRKMAAAHGVLDRIAFIGPVTDEHKWALYENALLFVLPSYSENFGNVVAEAMAMGCPVVVTPEVGLADLVRQTGSGVVSDGAPRILAEAILSLARDPARRRAMGESGRRTADGQLSADAAAGRMEAVYRKLCGSEPDSAQRSAA